MKKCFVIFNWRRRAGGEDGGGQRRSPISCLF
jgi:hypothetical protein